ncbi:MAG TPA: hypothetical protein VFH06_01955 [Candidatus Saccharimonadales bacterium]|nr:hypothetical protein [Candidatus Saccharimonadales bacterium]
MSSITRTEGDLRLEVVFPAGVYPRERNAGLGRWGYQESEVMPGSAIIIDLQLRTVLEEADASFEYTIFQGDTKLLHVYTEEGRRNYEGGEIVQDAQPKIIRF